MRVVGLHGHGQNPELFERLLKALVTKAKLPAVYPRGRFASTTPGGCSWYNYAKVKTGPGCWRAGHDRVIGAEAEYERLAKWLGASPDNVLVGFSEGGRFALNFAVRYPHLVRGLVLMCFPFPEADWQVLPFGIPTPALFVTSARDAVTNQFEMERVRRHFEELPEVVVHDRGHKVYLGAAVRNPALALLRRVSQTGHTASSGSAQKR